MKDAAAFVDANTVEVNGELIRAKHIVIATGAHAVSHLFQALDLGETSDDVFSRKLPEYRSHRWNPAISQLVAGVLHTLGVKTDLFVRRDRPCGTLIHIS